MIDKLNANHHRLMQIACDPQYTNNSSQEVRDIFATQRQLFDQLQAFKETARAHSK